MNALIHYCHCVYNIEKMSTPRQSPTISSPRPTFETLNISLQPQSLIWNKIQLHQTKNHKHIVLL